ncbi:MAG: efflux RND transporter periplasmic adaptor subunit [Syntrophales bacterium]|nr:efflux RND transporter periplasmic adaptor subunit [Syntrophales bacterium]
MKKVVVAIIILVVAGLAFLAGGRYGKEDSADPRLQGEPAYGDTIDAGQGDSGLPLVSGAVKISPARQQLIGVKVAVVEKKPMTYTLRLYGKVVPDETKLYGVNASTDCWIRDLSDVTTGSIVRENQILAEALAPAYYNAQATYLIALDNMDRIRQQLGGQTRHQQGDLANNQLRMAVQALQNLGITDAQVEELANKRQARPYLQVRSPTGGVVLSRNISLKQWFKAAEKFYTIADIGKVWVYADVYEDEAMHMSPGMTVAVKHGQMGKTFSARVGKVLPLFDPATRTLKVRIDVDNLRYDLRPDMFVDVEIPITKPPSVSVSADAVLDSGTQALVYVEKGGGIFEPRRVETGWRFGRQVEITGGLMPGEKIVVSGNFLIDSESRMEITASGAKVEMSGDTVRSGHVREKQMDGKKSDRAVMPGTDRSWAEMLDPARGRRGVRDGDAKAKQETRDSLGKSATSPGVIDWDGPDKEGAPARDWSGWGKFPGADFLGLKRKIDNNPAQQSNPAEAGGEEVAGKEQGGSKVAPTPAARRSEKKPGIKDRPASDQPRPSAK